MYPVILSAFLAALLSNSNPPLPETPQRSGRENPPATMTKIVVRRSSPFYGGESSEQKPYTVYRAGVTYSRHEAQASRKPDQKQLTISRERDVWMINLQNKRGVHYVDPGPVYGVHVPILPLVDMNDPMTGLEFGTEISFFRKHNARPLGERKLGAVDCTAMELQLAPWSLVLCTRKDRNIPVQLEVRHEEKELFTVHYDSYETDLALKEELFRVPGGIRIREKNDVVAEEQGRD